MTERWRPLNFPPSDRAAAHLGGFMGKELTSGRLPRYPSSVWKLIPSSVSKPRDPLAGGIIRVSAECVSPSLPAPLWTCVSESLYVLCVWVPDTLSWEMNRIKSVTLSLVSPFPFVFGFVLPESSVFILPVLLIRFHSALCVSIGLVEVGPVGRSGVILSAAVNPLLQTHDWPANACCVETPLMSKTFNCGQPLSLFFLTSAAVDCCLDSCCFHSALNRWIQVKVIICWWSLGSFKWANRPRIGEMLWSYNFDAFCEYKYSVEPA